MVQKRQALGILQQTLVNFSIHSLILVLSAAPPSHHPEEATPVCVYQNFFLFLIPKLFYVLLFILCQNKKLISNVSVWFIMSLDNICLRGIQIYVKAAAKKTNCKLTIYATFLAQTNSKENFSRFSSFSGFLNIRLVGHLLLKLSLRESSGGASNMGISIQ